MLKDALRTRKAQDLRRERDELGFVRQPEVRWLSPGLLVRSGIEVIVSGTFGRFADKRETQREPQDGLDYSDAGELWVDYLSDTGDGWQATYTMAWLLASPSLEAAGEELPRARILLLGGDQVYPSATPDQYEDRFIGPFASALPKSANPDKPDLYVLPGNHDWYDGLASFLRVFCTGEKQIGDWRTRQRRSYFALELPNDWWIWAIDIQLDTYLDDTQLDYFRRQRVAPDDKVILLTAKPSWVKAVPGRAEPASWRYLSYFEERVVRASGARLVMTLTGDLHHYARYEPTGAGAGAGDAPTRITAGGGGAYLSATHTLPETLDVRSLDHGASVIYERAEIYPRAQDSRRLSNGILKLARLNPSFAALLGGAYVLLGLAMLGALNAGAGPLDAGDGFVGFLSSAAGGMSILLALVLFGALFGATDIVPDALEMKSAKRRWTKLARVLVALLHSVIHLLLAAAIVYLAVSVAPGDAAIVAWLVGVALLFGAGAAAGATVFAAFLFAIHKARGPKAPEAANQVFAGQSIADYKNLVRMRFTADGSVTLYPLGVDAIGRDWRYEGDQGEGSRFAPRGAPPRVHAIDGPLRFDAAGRRAYSIADPPASAI